MVIILQYKYDVQKIKELLTDEQVYNYIEDLGGEPYWEAPGIMACKTICHGGDSHKLLYYSNTKLFRCYTHCQDYMDIFELTRRVLSIAEDKDVLLLEAIEYLATQLKIAPTSFSNIDNLSNDLLKSWKILKRYDKILEPKLNKTVELKKYKEDIFNHYPQPEFVIWEKEGISNLSSLAANLRFDPVNEGILIPHYDMDNNLVGIRIRFLAEDMMDKGKYKPAILNKELYNHPLSFNLYNLNKSKENIKKSGAALIFEGEKSCLQYKTMYGEDNDISVACCGSNISLYQIELLAKLKVKEIIICFDRQFRKIGDEEWFRHYTMLEKIRMKIKNITNVSFVEDWCGDILQYKSSPTDEGKEKFEKLLSMRRSNI